MAKSSLMHECVWITTSAGGGAEQNYLRMSRNQEKAQSMLYRFRQAQAQELGLPMRKNERRPKVITTVNSVRDCDKWRGEVMREITRKVARIQDFGLTDYEVRDLNDEINHLFREKGQWERQIAALGGANYRTGVPRILDDHGEEIPGMRGYRYYGRAKDLPGVKEHLNPVTLQEEGKESSKVQKYKRFQNQPGVYFGNDDEKDGILLEQEMQSEQRGWEKGCSRIFAALEIPNESYPPIPRDEPVALHLDAVSQGEHGTGKPVNEATMSDTPTSDAQEYTMTRYMNALLPEELEMPVVPGRQDIETFLLEAKKAALRNECTYTRAN